MAASSQDVNIMASQPLIARVIQAHVRLMCHSNHYADRDKFWQQSKSQSARTARILPPRFSLSNGSEVELPSSWAAAVALNSTVVLCLSCVGCSSRKRKGVILRKDDGTFSTQRASLERSPHPGVLEAYLCSELHPCGKSFIHRVLLVCSYDMSPKESQVVFLLNPTNASCCSSRLNMCIPCGSFSRIWSQELLYPLEHCLFPKAYVKWCFS